MLTLKTLEFLVSARGAALLEHLRDEDLSEQNTLSLLTRLRRELNGDEAGAALELARLRIKAIDKFGEAAARMYFTRDALEQASDPLIRRWRSSAISGAAQTITDMCCSIGSDALAFAKVGAAAIVGIDIDLLRVEMARLNADALNLAGDMVRFFVGDALDWVVDTDIVFYDPARRDAGGRRIHDVDRCQPPLSLINRWTAGVKIAKLSPAVDMSQIMPYLDNGWGVNFISVEGDLKEAELRSGALGRRAVCITADGSFEWQNCGLGESAPLDQPRRWLIEPDPSLIRAGLVDEAALAWGGAKLDPSIAYITADDPCETPWTRVWRVRDWMPFQVKALRSYLRERRIGSVTVKKRGTAVTPESLQAQLKLRGENSATLVLTRCQGRQIVLICDDYQPRQETKKAPGEAPLI